MRNTLVGTAAAAVICSSTTPAAAAVNLVEGESTEVRFGVYASNFSLFSRPDYQAADLIPQSFGANASLLRLEWSGGFGKGVSFVLHNRFFWSTSSLPAAESGTGLGLGSSIAPQRSLDLESSVFDEGGSSLTHDLDRFAVTVQSTLGDFTLGRQAITWGIGSIFTPNDIWSRFSPFELDTSQKRGVDAVRLLTYPADESELEVVLVDRGGLDDGRTRDVSAGIRVGWSGGAIDYYVGLAKNYEQALAMVGSTVDFDTFTARVEAQLRASTTGLRYDLPFATLGLDYQDAKASASLEYYFNGPGTVRAEEYARELLLAPDEEVARGDRYFVGRHYLGALASYSPIVELQLGAAATVNLLDPSAMLVPSLTYFFSQDVLGSLGAYVGVGEGPILGDPGGFQLGSEFGFLGTTYYFQLSGVM